MKKILQTILRIIAKIILKKYQPEVIGITGSVGKSSTKEAVYAVLKSKFNVRQNIKNYNNEIGVPLTIIGCPSGNQSFWSWLTVFFRAIKLLLVKDKNYPDILVLEFGADRPGDIKYLTNLVKCKIGILTSIGLAHLEFFKTPENVFREKRHLVTALDRDGVAVINLDDSYLKTLPDKLRAKVVTYGLVEPAEIKPLEVKVSLEPEALEINQKLRGMSFKVDYHGSKVPVFLPGVLGLSHVYAALAAVAVGTVYSLHLVDISQALKSYQSPPGRLKLIPGIKHTLLIDDSYNSSPQAAELALQELDKISLAKRKIVALGDMLELGTVSVSEHQRIGKLVNNLNLAFFVTVGELGKIMAQAAIKAGLNEAQVVMFDRAEEAGKFLQEKIVTGDVILVKGSQGVRMEKIVKELMVEPLRAKELLARQDESWK